MLECHNLTLSYGPNPIIEDLSISFASGKVAALCGPNGAGKSTLLAALASDLLPKSGAIKLAGVSLAALTPVQLARARAVLEQSPSLSAAFCTRVLTGLSIPREVPPAEAIRITNETLSALELSAMADRPVHQLSGGQRHRAHLARALAQLAGGKHLGGGQALMLDEPTASLDIAHQITVMLAARRAASEGTAVVVVLHDLNLAAAFADRVVLLSDGKIVADGTPSAALTEKTLTRVYAAPVRVGPGPTILPDYARAST